MLGETKFLNDFIVQPMQAAALAQFLNLKTVIDCVRFAASIPFVPDTVARYYTEQNIGHL